MQVATIPITFPIITAVGIDPVWYGIFIVLMCELGLITPPVGMNLFVVHGIRPDKGGIEDAIWGALPYAIIMIVHPADHGVARDLAASPCETKDETPCGSYRPELQLLPRGQPGRWRSRRPAGALDEVNPRLNAVIVRRDQPEGQAAAVTGARRPLSRWTAYR
jgi:hypothetical protein